MLLVASPFSRTKDAVVNAASDLILTAQHELQKIETDPNLTLTQKVAFKNALADLLQMLNELGERKGFWPKFIYVKMKNPNALMKKAHEFHHNVKITSRTLEMQLSMDRLSRSLSESGTSVGSTRVSTLTGANSYVPQTSEPPHLMYGEIRDPTISVNISADDVSLPRVMERLGDDEGRARARQLAGMMTTLALRRDFDQMTYDDRDELQDTRSTPPSSGSTDAASAAQTPLGQSQTVLASPHTFDSLIVGAESGIRTAGESSAWAASPVNRPGRSRNVMSFLNSSQTSFSGKTYPDGNAIEAGAIFSVNKAVWEEVARGEREPGKWRHTSA